MHTENTVIATKHIPECLKFKKTVIIPSASENTDKMGYPFIAGGNIKLYSYFGK
jgi:hypothetical protein